MFSKSALAAPEVSRSMAIGALAGLAILRVVMLAALFTQTSPYLPLALAPLFGASLALSVFVVAMVYAGSRWFVLPTVLGNTGVSVVLRAAEAISWRVVVFRPNGRYLSSNLCWVCAHPYSRG